MDEEKSLRMNPKKISALMLGVVFIISVAVNAYSAEIPDPESYFGFKPGADYKLIRWDKIVSYFDILGEKSPRIVVKDLGKTTLGNPFLLAIISSPENLSRLDVYSGQSGHLFRFKAATDRSEATLDDHYTSLWPE
jgi:hypothetical protein